MTPDKTDATTSVTVNTFDERHGIRTPEQLKQLQRRNNIKQISEVDAARQIEADKVAMFE